MKEERILYASDLGSEGLMHLHTMRPNGSDPRRLTKTAEVEPEGVGSPDGRRIAGSMADPGASASDLFVLDADGTNRKRLTASPRRVRAFSPSWSPDSKRLVYSVQRDTGSALWQIGADGSGAKELGPGMLPRWSPDGKRILLTDLPQGAGPDAKPSLYVTDADGRGRKLLVPDAAMGGWSPDGARIALITIDSKGAMNVAVCDADGKRLKPITRLDDPFVSGPMWLPDGKTILFTRALNPGPKAKSADMAIYSVPATGGAPKRLSRGGSMNFVGNGSAFFLLMGALAAPR